MNAFIETIVAGLLAGSVYALVAGGLALEFGVLRILNFAHGYLVMVAMYACAAVWRAWDVSPYVFLVAVVPLAFAAGMGLYYGVVRPFVRRGASPIVIALATLAAAVVIEQALTALSGASPRAVRIGLSTQGWSVLGVQLSAPRLVAAIVAAVVLAGVAALLRWTRWGRYARAVAQDADSAKAMGIDPARVSAITFGIGTALAAVAGTVLITFQPATPDGGLNLSLISFVVVVLGGLSSFKGAWLAALLVGVVTALVGYYWDPELQTPAYLVLLVLALALRPQGLFGLKGDLGEIRA